MHTDSTTRTIPLGHSLFAVVDERDHERVAAHKWYVNSKGYAVAHVRHSDGSRGMMRLHRFVIGAQAGDVIDHVNGDKLDCRTANLRKCSHSESACNRRRRSDNASGYTGVSWYAPLKVWKAKVVKDGHAYHLGYFSDALHAALAYDSAAAQLHGEFAALNFG